jgi:hypothetical protein
MSEPGQRKDDLSGGDQQSSADFEAGLKKEFAASADLQAEFGNDEAAYVAFKKAESAGRVGIFKKGTSEPGQSEDDLSGGGQQLSADFEAGLKKEFAESADLQSEFGGKVEYYIAYRKAMAAGRVGHIVMGKVIKSSSKNTEEANSQKQQLPEPNKFSDSNADEETRRFVEENGTPCGPDGGIYDERRNAFVSRPALV